MLPHLSCIRKSKITLNHQCDSFTGDGTDLSLHKPTLLKLPSFPIVYSVYLTSHKLRLLCLVTLQLCHPWLKWCRSSCLVVFLEFYFCEASLCMQNKTFLPLICLVSVHFHALATNPKRVEEKFFLTVRFGGSQLLFLVKKQEVNNNLIVWCQQNGNIGISSVHFDPRNNNLFNYPCTKIPSRG